MNDQNQYQTAQKSLEEAKKVLVLLPPMPTEDLVNAALSLHLALVESGKQSQIGCSSEIEVNPSILETEKIKDSVGSRNLTISFDYHEDDLDKVDYDVRADGKFYLVVKPKTNAPVPDVSGVKFSYSGADADLVVVFGIHTLEELGKIYSEEKTFLDSANILSINNSPRTVSFGCQSLHLLISTYVELITQLLEKSALKLSEAAANNLLFGIYDSTNNLTSPKVSADTFATVAFLMRAGARLPNQQRNVPRFAQAPFFEIPTHSQPEIQEDPRDEIVDEPPIPQDWKKPKIFRAGEKTQLD